MKNHKAVAALALALVVVLTVGWPPSPTCWS